MTTATGLKNVYIYIYIFKTSHRLGYSIMNTHKREKTIDTLYIYIYLHMKKETDRMCVYELNEPCTVRDTLDNDIMQCMCVCVCDNPMISNCPSLWGGDENAYTNEPWRSLDTHLCIQCNEMVVHSNDMLVVVLYIPRDIVNMYILGRQLSSRHFFIFEYFINIF